MITSVEVFKLIKQVSRRTVNPLHRILLDDILSEFSISEDAVLVLLAELQNRGLILIHHSVVPTVSLTNYGSSTDAPPGGFTSQGG